MDATFGLPVGILGCEVEHFERVVHWVVGLIADEDELPLEFADVPLDDEGSSWALYSLR